MDVNAAVETALLAFADDILMVFIGDAELERAGAADLADSTAVLFMRIPHPGEADLPTVATVCFTRRGEYVARALHAVPSIVFSEAMRDLDRVVSVAHAGGVDPDATASTTQMRATLIRETAWLLKPDNISFRAARPARTVVRSPGNTRLGCHLHQVEDLGASRSDRPSRWPTPCAPKQSKPRPRCARRAYTARCR